MTAPQAHKYAALLAITMAVGVVLLVLGLALSDALLRTTGLSLTVMMALLLAIQFVRSGRGR